MNELIKIDRNIIDGQEINTVDARTLHGKLEVKRDFSSWIKARLKKYNFINGIDYLIDSPIRGNQTGRGGNRRSKDYILTTDVAKELCMVENNELGRKFRRYFIECERRLLEGSPQSNNDPLLAGLIQSMTAMMDTFSSFMATQGGPMAQPRETSSQPAQLPMPASQRGNINKSVQAFATRLQESTTCRGERFTHP